MAASSNSNRYYAVHALLHRLLRVAQTDDIVKYEAAIRVHGRHDFLGWTQTGNDDRYLMFDAGFHVLT